MAIAIGFRVEGKKVHWAVISKHDNGELVLEECGDFSQPRGYSEAQGLSFVRQRVEQLLNLYAPELGGVKYTEPIARGGGGDGARARARVEGVIMQRLDEAAVRVLGAAYNAISPRLGTASAKALLTDPTLRGLDWSAVPGLQKEAILAAAAALEG